MKNSTIIILVLSIFIIITGGNTAQAEVIIDTGVIPDYGFYGQNQTHEITLPMANDTNSGVPNLRFETRVFGYDKDGNFTMQLVSNAATDGFGYGHNDGQIHIRYLLPPNGHKWTISGSYSSLESGGGSVNYPAGYRMGNFIVYDVQAPPPPAGWDGPEGGGNSGGSGAPQIVKAEGLNGATCTSNGQFTVCISASGADHPTEPYSAQVDSGPTVTSTSSQITVNVPAGQEAHMIHVQAKNAAGKTAVYHLPVFLAP